VIRVLNFFGGVWGGLGVVYELFPYFPYFVEKEYILFFYLEIFSRKLFYKTTESKESIPITSILTSFQTILDVLCHFQSAPEVRKFRTFKSADETI
jgi:hypothetical protein